MKLIVGLWNPWKNYENTRHNIWFHFLDTRSQQEQLGNRKFQAKFQAETLMTQWNDQKILLCKPQTYMNLSGNAIAPLMRFYDIPSKDLLVLHDEIDFITGRIALKFGGSPAGHNGLKSTIEKLWTRDFWRIRIGIDRPQDQNLVSNRVLGKFKAEEKQLLESKSDEIFGLIEEFLVGK